MRNRTWVPVLTMVLLLAGCGSSVRSKVVEQRHIEIDPGEGRLTLYAGENLMKQYAVGVGTRGTPPLGSYIVFEKISEPVWWDADGNEIPYGHKDNSLGARWLSLRATGDTPDIRGFGIHGFWDGARNTAGSISMRDQDVIELFDLVDTNTPVRVVRK